MNHTNYLHCFLVEWMEVNLRLSWIDEVLIFEFPSRKRKKMADLGSNNTLNVVTYKVFLKTIQMNTEKKSIKMAF